MQSRKQKQMKRGEIAISVVIIIALGLIVLITLATLLVGSGERVQNVTSACEDTYGGTCTTRTACLADGGRIVGGVTCSEEYTTEYDSTWTVEQFPDGGGVCCKN